MINPKIKKMQLNALNLATYNPRVISPEAVEGLTRSIDKFGCVEPIIVNIREGKNVIVGGHQRYQILQSKGIKEIKCVIIDLSETDERLLNVSLNNPHLQGEFISEIATYIETLQADLTADGNNALLDLRIEALKEDINKSADLSYKEQELVPYKKCHVLLSFPPQLIGEVSNALESLLKLKEVEYEQSAN